MFVVMYLGCTWGGGCWTSIFRPDAGGFLEHADEVQKSSKDEEQASELPMGGCLDPIFEASNFVQTITDSGTREILQIDSLIPARLAPDWFIICFTVKKQSPTVMYRSLQHLACLQPTNYSHVILKTHMVYPQFCLWILRCSFWNPHSFKCNLMFNFNHHKIPWIR